MSARPCGPRLAHPFLGILLVGLIAASSLAAPTQGTVDRLIGQLRSGDLQARKAAVAELERIGPRDRAAVAALASALADRDEATRLRASEALKNLGAASAPAVDALVSALASRTMGVSTNAQQALVAIGPPAIPALIASLERLPERGRRRAVWVLGYLGDEATPALIEAMKNDQADVRVVAIRAFIEMGEKGQRAVPALVRALGDGDEDVRESAAAALSQIGAKARSAAHALEVALEDSAWSVRREAAGALARINPEPAEAMPALETAIKNDAKPEVRAAAAAAIVSVARSAADRNRAALHLIVALEDKDAKVRKASASALGTLGADASAAVGPLTGHLLKDSDRHMRSWAADALGEIGPPARSAVPSLIAALKESDPWLRRIAAEALGKIASASGDVVSALILALRDPVDTAREGAAGALVTLAERSARAGDYAAIEPLDRAYSALESGDARTHTPNALERLEAALESLEESERADWARWLAKLTTQHPLTAGLAGLLCLYLTWLVLLRFAILKIWPLAVLRWSRALGGKFELELPAILGKRKVSLRSLAMAGSGYHPLALDAWVTRHAATARDRFVQSPTVSARSTYVPIPLFANGKPAATLNNPAILSIRGKDRWSVTIAGEDGLGKTTLACQLALWGLAEAPPERLCRDVQMLPVLIEPAAAGEVCGDSDTLIAAVKSKVRDFADPAESLPDEFIDRLLRTRRILVLLDGPSKAATLSQGSPSGHTISTEPDFPASALVVATRVALPDSTVVVEPQRLDRDHLLPFVSAYLARAGLGHLPDATIYQVCARLAEMVGPDRGVTPLLARSLVDEVVAAVRAGRSPLDLPASISELLVPLESGH